MIAPEHRVETFETRALNRGEGARLGEFKNRMGGGGEELRTKANDNQDTQKKKETARESGSTSRQQVRVSLQDLWF